MSRPRQPDKVERLRKTRDEIKRLKEIDDALTFEIGNYMKRAETHILGIPEPEAPPDEPSHWELGLSELGVDTYMH